MNASTRKLLQKRKQLMYQSRNTAVSIEEEEIRQATRLKFEELLNSDDSKCTDDVVKRLSKEIEEQLHKTYKANSPQYKSNFRKLYVSLKNEKSEFRVKLLDGSLDPNDFALKTSDELKSKDLQSKDESIKREEMRMSIGKQLLPETVNQLKDGRDREKWGVSRSAAAIDD